MFRALVLAYWETRRMLRSRGAVTALLIVPAASAAAHLALRHGTAHIRIWQLFPVVAAVVACLLLYLRAAADRLSGFAAALDSTPSAGFTILAGRTLASAAAALFQIGVFAAVVRLVGQLFGRV